MTEMWWGRRAVGLDMDDSGAYTKVRMLKTHEVISWDRYIALCVEFEEVTPWDANDPESWTHLEEYILNALTPVDPFVEGFSEEL